MSPSFPPLPASEHASATSSTAPGMPAGETRSAAPPGRGRRVVDAATRMFHWLFALCFVGAYATGDSEHWRLVHVTLGYTMAGLLVFRILYGLVGPRHARLSGLWRRLAGARSWLRDLYQRRDRSGRPMLPTLADADRALRLAAPLSVAVMLLAVPPLALTGLVAYQEWGGEWLAELHEVIGEGFFAVVIAHLAALLLLSLRELRNRATPMLTGRTAGPGPDLVRHDLKWLAALQLLAVFLYWGWEFVRTWTG